MAKRTRDTQEPAGSAQPEPAPGGAMTEPTAGAAGTASEPVELDSPTTEAAAEAPLTVTSPDATAPAQAAEGSLEELSAETVSAAAAAAWPDVSNVPAEPRCPWCSAVLPGEDLVTCPSCGAQLNGAAEAEVPGVTTIDVSALAWKAGAPPRRNKLMSWISGDVDDEVDLSKVSPGAVEPPSLAVRREILRLELEAEGISLPHDAEPSEEDEVSAGVEAASGQEPSSSADPPEPRFAATRRRIDQRLTGPVGAGPPAAARAVIPARIRGPAWSPGGSSRAGPAHDP